MQNFNYHAHTARCGHAEPGFSDEEYVKEAIEAGMKQIAFTDHMPFPLNKKLTASDMFSKMPYSQKNDYLISIKKLKEKYKEKIDIKVGFEIEYIPSMHEHILDLRKETDILIIGQHYVEKNNKIIDFFKKLDNYKFMSNSELDLYVNSIEQALQNHLVDIIAHPDLFLHFRKTFGKKEEKACHRILEIASKYNIPLEINLKYLFDILIKIKKTDSASNILTQEAWEEMISAYKYPSKQFWRIASQYNIRTIYGLDIHNSKQIFRMSDFTNIVNTMIGEEYINKFHFVDHNLQ